MKAYQGTAVPSTTSYSVRGFTLATLTKYTGRCLLSEALALTWAVGATEGGAA